MDSSGSAIDPQNFHRFSDFRQVAQRIAGSQIISSQEIDV
jgi:hypothetical protein